MAATVHKILEHGPDVMKYFLLPLEMLWKDAQETRTQDLRILRLNNTRKTSREASNKDLLTRLLISSDPYMASLKKIRINKSSVLDVILARLLKFEDEYPGGPDNNFESDDKEFL